MRKIGKYFLVPAVIAINIPLIVFILIRLTPQPPVNKMEYARKTLSEARFNKADIYSEKFYGKANLLYDSAMLKWQNENRRFIYFRNYDNVEFLAGLSAVNAGEAIKSAKSNASDLIIRLQLKIDSLRNIITELDKNFTTYPLSPEVRTAISKGKLMLKEAEIDYNTGAFVSAYRKTSDSEMLLRPSFEIAGTDLIEYFNSFSLWKKWTDKTINESKLNHNYALIIDKFSHKCMVYYNGVKRYEYNVELGRNWVGDKRIKGDYATPEGMYKIIKKIDSYNTKYYKALLLDYPNEEDNERFKQEIANGTLPASAKQGSLIELHGNGGKGIDWTEGCIALTDSEMDVVFKIVKTGTPVTIVGSTVNLQQLLKR
jgi:hypothetical protein